MCHSPSSSSPLQDFGFTIFWCFMWLVVSAEWASGQYRLLSMLKDVAGSNSECDDPSISYSDILTLLQSNIAVVSCSAAGQESEGCPARMHSPSLYMQCVLCGP